MIVFCIKMPLIRRSQINPFGLVPDASPLRRAEWRQQSHPTRRPWSREQNLRNSPISSFPDLSGCDSPCLAGCGFFISHTAVAPVAFPEFQRRKPDSDAFRPTRSRAAKKSNSVVGKNATPTFGTIWTTLIGSGRSEFNNPEDCME